MILLPAITHCYLITKNQVAVLALIIQFPGMGDDKWKTVIVPVTQEQYNELQRIFDSVAAKTPYDYAIFGMRCAAASYDVLSKIGLFKEFTNSKNGVI